MATKREKRDPYLWEALISILGLVLFISLAILRYETDPHVPILLGVLVAAVVGLRAGFSWKEIETGMLNGITNALQAIVILLIIGILIGVWIQTGVVPTMLFYGLKILHPKIFLPAALIICSITALATGTSWGTTGTIGIALIGIGAGLGFPLPVVAGAVLSGAYFGDKMSPLSDTTNMAPAMVGTDLYTHIKHMTYTTGVSYGLTLVIEFVLGFFYGGGQAAKLDSVNQMLTGIDAQFSVNPLLLLPPIIVMVLAFRRIPAVPGIVMGILAAGVLGAIFQGNTFGNLLSAAYGGYVSNSGVEAVDNLLTKGGFESMLYTVSLVICAMMFGGIMEKTNQLRVVVSVILKKAQSTGSLITSTILTAIASNLILCDQYMAIVMTGKMYAQSYTDQNLHPKNLSRAIEDSATVTANLVPWNSGGAYQAATLGVPTIAYLPFNFFCWLTPIVSIIYGWFNITIDPLEEEVEATDMAAEAGTA
ncbi:MAG: Na+/H+ antiporter NhaC [Desulfobacterales bacterium]|jgi:NhaC family Na+:H+ antiporter|nr:Na+/H+ antiporter NhaC [Desulfobacterales bacterium]MDH3837060.1 Na+/H+ antiporter NhaC [Desulfobacteraceae bacterium]MDH3876701.1 Na+/H+ antiporter NhaC [Desulfobacterales bacterium]MDH4010668.1 Na+/H+ antiporter NhaC [Desulfobacterales bacterium]